MNETNLERIQPISDEEKKRYSFDEWIRQPLAEIDPNVEISELTEGRFSVVLGGEWQIATVYGPTTGLLGAWLDEYPREVQTEIFRRIVFCINSWYGGATNPDTGLRVSKKKDEIVQAATELARSEWAMSDMRYVPNELFKKLKAAVEGSEDGVGL